MHSGAAISGVFLGNLSNPHKNWHEYSLRATFLEKNLNRSKCQDDRHFSRWPPF